MKFVLIAEEVFQYVNGSLNVPQPLKTDSKFSTSLVHHVAIGYPYWTESQWDNLAALEGNV
jgi:hypothetical protein